MTLRTLTIRLGQGTTRQELPDQVERNYLGGRGLVAWILYNQLPVDTAPLAAENLLVFAAGPLAGVAAFANGGFIVGTRSPLTGSIGYGWAQGHWGSALRRAGYDALVIAGQAAEWSCIDIVGEQVRIRSASHLEGMDTQATAATLRAELSRDTRVVCIGPAAESKVAYASIVAEGRYMAEPAGAGAVMANKRIKAITVRDAAPSPAADERKLQLALDITRRRVDNSSLARDISQVGSSRFFAAAIEQGAITERNGQSDDVSDGTQSLRLALLARGRRESRGCAECPMPCYFDYARRSETATGSPGYPQPELEIIAGFGARCGITNPDALIAIADRCLRLGLDPASTSAAIAFMMEIQETGLTPTRNLSWGDANAVIAAIDRIVQLQQKRDVISLGIGEMREIFWGSADFAPQVKGLAMPALDPRALNGIGLAMATAAIGGDFRYAMNYEELVDELPNWLPNESDGPRTTTAKVRRLIWHERFAAVLDALGLCRRLGLMAYQVSPGEALALIAATTGHTISGADMIMLGERILTVERLFARRYSDNGAVDELPARWRDETLEAGPAAGHLPPIDDLLAEYYQRHGWNSQGDPPPEWLARLGIAPLPPDE